MPLAQLNKELNYQLEELTKDKEEGGISIIGELLYQVGMVSICSVINPKIGLIRLVDGIKSMHSKINQFEEGLDKKYPLARYKNKLKTFESVQSNIKNVEKLP